MPNSVVQWINDLTNADGRRRLTAAENLCHQAEAAQPAAVALAKAAADEDDDVREAVVAALEDLGPPPLEQLDQLTPLLADPNGDVAYWAATLLGRLGSSAAPAVAALTSALAPAAPLTVRQRAAWALGNVGPAAASATPALEMAAAHNDPRLARLAKQALDQIRAK
jgi:HEAT repeat protein